MNRLLNGARDTFATVTSRFRENALPEISAHGDISNILPIHVPAHANVEEGFSPGGLTFRPFPSDGVPLLDSFFFQYTQCQNHSCFGQVDHNITQILIAPNFPEPNQLQLGFHDVNLDDDYYFNVAHHILTDPRIERFDTGLDIGVGSETRGISTPSPVSDFVFVLLGFQLAFRGVDHFINEIGIIENDGEVTVHYADKNFDDTFLFRLRYAYVPIDLFSRWGELRGTRARSFDRRFIESGTSVIRGFHFDFKPYFTDGEDHRIKQIGVLTADGEVQVAYADQNDDDGFDWVVRYGILS
jgi:hypothetical protein